MLWRSIDILRQGVGKLFRFASRAEYDFVFVPDAVSADGLQIRNTGQATEDATVYRNAVELDGLTNFVKLGYTIGANDAIEMRMVWNKVDGTNQNMGVYHSAQARYYIGIYGSKWALVVNDAFAVSTVDAVVGKEVTVMGAGNKMFIDGAFVYEQSPVFANRAPYPFYLGVINDKDGTPLASYCDCSILRTRIATYTNISLATGDLDADIAAGLCVLKPDWRMRTQDITLGPDSILDDNGGTYDIAAAAISGANLLGSVNSIYDVVIPNSVSNVIEEPIGTATATIADGASFTMEATIACAGGVATHTAEVIAGYATDTVGEWMGFTVTSGNKINAAISDGTTSTVIYGPVDLPTVATDYKMEYDSVAQTVTVSIDGAAETPVAYTDTPAFAAGGEHGTLLGLSGVVYTRLKDPLITVTRFEEDS